MKKIKLFELFAGIGAPRKALRDLGIEVESLGYSEINKHAITAYCEIHNDTPDKNWGDITKITKLPDNIDILFHGSPCQDFSIAGKMLGGDENSKTRSALMWETMRLVKTSKPKCVVWENVKGIKNKNNIHNYNKYLDEMEKLGYHNLELELSPLDIDFPQSRPRVFVISSFIPLKFNKIKTNKYSKQLTDIIDFENIEHKLTNAEQYNIDLYLRDNPGINENVIIPIISNNFNSRLKRKKGYYNYCPCISCRSSDFIKINKQGQASKLKGSEKLALQGFDDLKTISENQKHIVAGNSINVYVLMYIFENLVVDTSEKKVQSLLF